MTLTYYTKTARVLHWLMAFLFIFAWLIGFFTVHGLINSLGQSFETGITLHKSIASVLIFLLIIRIFWRWTHPVPPLPDSIPEYMKKLAHLGHLMLYLILIILPISGCLISWSSGHEVPVLYLFNLPKLVQNNPTILEIAIPVHIFTAWAAGFVVLGHILMAFKHHLIDKDTVLLSMLGPRKKKSSISR